MNHYKKINLILLTSAVLAAVGAFQYWKSICSQHLCSHALIDGILDPIEKGGYILAIFFGVFLLLPSHYFQTWLKKIFSWAFPLSLILVLTTEDSSSILAFSRTLVVQILGTFFGIVTAFFVLHRFLKLRKEQKTSKI